jgi:segregation and condensation protein B
MNLQGKIEAIIYAAEEPVTLDQLASLLKADVLSEIEAQASSQSDALFAPSTEDARGSEPGAVGAETLQQDAATDALPAPPEAPTETSTGREQPSEARQHSERTPESQEPLSVPEPLAASASVSSGAAVAPKKKKAADPELSRVKVHLRGVMEQVVATYASDDRGVEIRQIAGGYRMATKPEHHDLVRAFAKSLKPPIKLSLQALETLAIIAYKQPVTGPEIADIRGVDSGGVLGTLLDRKLITTAGRKQVIGRPMQYKTTKEFLVRFGMNDLNELPSMEEFEKLAQEQTDMFSREVPPETGPTPFETEDASDADTAAANAEGYVPDHPGDYSTGADTSETIVRAQLETGEEASQTASADHEGAPHSVPQRPPEEPAEPADAGDISSGADTSETIIREQFENEAKK